MMALYAGCLTFTLNSLKLAMKIFLQQCRALFRANGPGTYVIKYHAGQWEDLGLDDDGKENGYHLKWGGSPGSVLSAMPYLVGTTDQNVTTLASGTHYYIVYDASDDDIAAANAVLAQSLENLPSDHTLYPDADVKILEFVNAYNGWAGGTVAILMNVHEMEIASRSKVFNDYSGLDLNDRKIALKNFAKARKDVCDDVIAGVIAYYFAEGSSKAIEDEAYDLF